MTGSMLKKIWALFIREKQFFFLMIVCTFLSGIVLCMCFGVFCNYIEAKNAGEHDLRMLEIPFDDDVENGRYITKKQVADCVMQLSDNVTEDVDMFFVRSRMNNGFLIACRFMIDEGEYRACQLVRNNLVRTSDLNDYFTDDDEREGKKVAIIPNGEWTEEMLSWMDGRAVIDDMMTDASHINVNGEIYEVIGDHKFAGEILVPFQSLSDDTVIDAEGLTLTFKESISPRQYNEVKTVVEDSLGDAVHVPKMPVLDHYRMTIYNTAIFLDILVAVWIALNFSILYRYILICRKKEIGIFLACGLNKNKMLLYITLSLCLMLLPVFLLAIVIFHIVILPMISWMIQYAVKNYTFIMYLCMNVIFGIVLLTVTGITVGRIIYDTDIMTAIKGDRSQV